MKQIILASHGKFAEGAADTLKMVLGDVPGLHVITFDMDDAATIEKPARELMESIGTKDDVYVLTDMMGSSVHTAMANVKKDFPNMILISGMNFPLVLSVAMPMFGAKEDALAGVVEECKGGMVIC